MPYVLSKLANTQVYTKYAKDVSNNLNVVVEQIEIKGGADITDKHFITPTGVVTEVTNAQLEILKENKDFQRHLDNGVINIFGFKPNVDKEVDKMTPDKSKPLTPSDYIKKGKKAPKTKAIKDDE